MQIQRTGKFRMEFTPFITHRLQTDCSGLNKTFILDYNTRHGVRWRWPGRREIQQTMRKIKQHRDARFRKSFNQAERLTISRNITTETRADLLLAKAGDVRKQFMKDLG